MTHYQAIIHSPLGYLGIRTTEDHLLGIDFLPASVSIKQAVHDFSQQVVAQLQQYFQNPHSHFTIPYQIQGSDFQRKVWAALNQIPVGTALYYSALAQQLHTGARAIGGACRSNPLPIISPCHRIIGRYGLGGYAGTTQQIQPKLWLLKHEGFLS